MTFMTLCESYMRIDLHFDLWNYFFCFQRPHDPDAELTNLRGVVIHVKFGHGVDPYFDITVPTSMKGWRKQWFYLRNDVDTPLPMFTGNRPIPHPNLGYGVAKKDLNKLKPLHEVI
jgi:hypothetical protein